MEKEESALEENIRVKGKNSYYYAHQKKDVGDHIPTKWDGAEAPRRLDVTTADCSISTTAAATPIHQYAWADGKKKVDIYVELSGIGAHPEENFDLTFEETSLTLIIKEFNDKDLKLHFPALYESILDVKLKQKADKIVLTLKKAKELSWYTLKKEK